MNSVISPPVSFLFDLFFSTSSAETTSIFCPGAEAQRFAVYNAVKHCFEEAHLNTGTRVFD